MASHMQSFIQNGLGLALPPKLDQANYSEPCLLHPMLPSISENYIKIKVGIQGACLELSEIGTMDIAAIGRGYCAPGGRPQG